MDKNYDNLHAFLDFGFGSIIMQYFTQQNIMGTSIGSASRIWFCAETIIENSPKGEKS